MILSKNSKIYVSFLAILLSGAFVNTMSAQSNSTESPYTRFGYGSLTNHGSSRSRSMGGVAIATRESDLVNPLNPASYAAVDSQTFIFDFAASVGFSLLKEGKQQDTRMLGNIEYISLLFPITHWLGISAGLLPYSTVGYRFGREEKLSGIEDVSFVENYNGQGNINDIYLGLGISPFKRFSLGINTSYRFGALTHFRTLEFQNTDAFNQHFYDRLVLKGLGLNVGIQYGINLGKEQEILLGVTYSPSMAFRATEYNQELVLKGSQVAGIIRSDTIKDNNNYKTPHALGFGISYKQQNKLFVEMDVKYNMWNNKLPINSTFEPKNQIVAALGASFIPNWEGRSLGKRIEYRIGLNGSSSYFALNQGGLEKSRYYEGGISFGVGIPLADRRSILDLGLDYRHLFPQSTRGIHENYLMMTIGLRFNEGWFKKLKLD